MSNLLSRPFLCRAPRQRRDSPLSRAPLRRPLLGAEARLHAAVLAQLHRAFVLPRDRVGRLLSGELTGPPRTPDRLSARALCASNVTLGCEDG